MVGLVQGAGGCPACFGGGGSCSLLRPAVCRGPWMDRDLVRGRAGLGLHGGADRAELPDDRAPDPCGTHGGRPTMSNDDVVRRYVEATVTGDLDGQTALRQ